MPHPQDEQAPDASPDSRTPQERNPLRDQPGDKVPVERQGEKLRKEYKSQPNTKTNKAGDGKFDTNAEDPMEEVESRESEDE